MKFEYHTHYFPITYEKGGTTGIVFKKEHPITDPSPESLHSNPHYLSHLAEMGAKGWELISVQPLLSGMYQYQTYENSGYGFGYSLTAGYYLFWKRSI